MANLVIVESPTKAGTIKGYLGSGYTVIASDGHIRDLPKSTLGVDIENDFTAKYINIRGKAELINKLKKQAKAATHVFLATDPDREGEAISWHLQTALGLDPAKTKRVTFNEVTKTAVRAGIKNPRSIDMDLVSSQQARRILDRIVGYKLSPFLWKTVKSGLSAGRVQSVATRAIVDREAEIRAFVPQEYWTLEAALSTGDDKTFHARFAGGEHEKITLDSQEVTERVMQAAGEKLTVRSVKKALRYKTPAPPFITSTLQQEANRKLGFQTQRTMRTAQELYEGIDLGSAFGGVNGLISYMRTDSLRISTEAQQAAEAYIKEHYGERYYPEKAREFKSRSTAQDAHEAIRPSDLRFDPESIKKRLSADQYKLYRLIWNRFLSSQMQSEELDTVTAEFIGGGMLFRSSGYTVRFKGFTVLYEESEEETNGEDSPTKGLKLPELTEGQSVAVAEMLPKMHMTEPPQRFNEASLIRFFEETGIGRPSTYSTILTTIISRGYVRREGKTLMPTKLGEITNGLMTEYFPHIVDYAFTAEMEERLDGIAQGNSTATAVLSDFYGDFETALDNATEKAPAMSAEIEPEKTDMICEKCGAQMIVKNGRYGKFAACPNYPTCRNTKPLVEKKADGTEAGVQKTDLKCELCGADVVIRPGKFGSFYACSRYPACKYTKQILHEIGVLCPKCGGKLVQKRGRSRRVFYSCENYPTCDFSSWDAPQQELCPQCGQMLFLKKGKGYLYCRTEGCGYRRAYEPKDGEDAGDNETGNEA